MKKYTKVDLDLADLNYLLSHEELTLPDIKEQMEAISLWKTFKSFVIYICFGIKYMPTVFNRKYFSSLKRSDIVLISSTLNNYRALYPISKVIKASSMLSYSHTLDQDSCVQRNLRRAHVTSLFAILRLLSFYRKSSPYIRKSILTNPSLYLISYGIWNEAFQVFRKMDPKILIVANDHVCLTRSYFRQAQVLGIKTIYVQHASVTEYFPKLEFDYAFLDGQETVDKYSKHKPIDSHVVLTGSPRFDVIAMIQDCSESLSIGIAINELDKQSEVTTFIMNLKSKIPHQISLRPHPAQANEFVFWINFCETNNLIFSNPLIESPFEFIAKNKFFIAGETSFHLDVILTGKSSFYYNFMGSEVLDWYGYLKTGLISVFSTEALSNEVVVPVEVVQYYVANFGTPYWGKSIDLIELEINKILCL